MTVRILIGDVRDQLATLSPDSVDCCVTSPPYWGLRDYDVEGQIGLEPTLGEHLAVMVEVFEAVKRVLKPEGTLWLNYGDCYATKPNGRSAAATKAAERGVSQTGKVVAGGTLKPKDLCMIPNRLAIALQDAGWWVRSEIVWGKPNPMPDSSGRCGHDSHHRKGREKGRLPGVTPKSAPATDKFNRANESFHASTTGMVERRFLRNYEPDLSAIVPLEVWNIATAAFSEAHFATFPPGLVAPCIMAGCPEGELVLDPFGGAGTTGLVAERRIRGDQGGLLADVEMAA